MRSDRGFTLLEVLVSIAIIAAALVALLSLQNRSLRRMESAELLEGARLLSARLMGEGELSGVPGGEQTGSEGPYTWVLTETRMTRESLPADVPMLRGVHLSLQISWNEGRRAEKLSLAEFIYGK